MKKVTKLMAIAGTAIAIFFATNVKAQTVDKSAWRLGIGVEGGLPTGDIHNTSSWDLGGTARLQYGIDKNVAIMLTSGYYNFFGKDYTATIVSGTGVTSVTAKAPNFGLIPVKAGAKVFFNSPIYVSGEAGAGFETASGGGTRLLLSPGLGWANHSWDIGARYENLSGGGVNYGLVNLRVAYGFTL
ncbi:MAG: hypothetical protein JST50_11675 [Bacteroidetes bacterium]|jgi:hypothetical protein|nr:hypothetical protein [Bacteroidota bacterium]